MLINKDHLKSSQINSRVHKVRAIIKDFNGNIYITNMNNAYNLPGGRVENKEGLKQALRRELKEELGITVTYQEMQYIGNFVFWHKEFSREKKEVNRENIIDLFIISLPKEIKIENIKLTNYEKHYHFCLMSCTLAQIRKLLKEKNDNEYKRFTNIELKTIIQVYKKYRKEENYVR